MAARLGEDAGLAPEWQPGGYWARSLEDWMPKREEIVSDLWWGILSVVGVLAATGFLALGFRVFMGGW